MCVCVCVCVYTHSMQRADLVRVFYLKRADIRPRGRIRCPLFSFSFRPLSLKTLESTPKLWALPESALCIKIITRIIYMYFVTHFRKPWLMVKK